MIPGWPYSMVAALEPGRTSWTAVLDALRLGPADDETAVTAAQVRDVVAPLIQAGHWREGDLRILAILAPGMTSAGSLTCWRTCRRRCWGGLPAMPA